MGVLYFPLAGAGGMDGRRIRGHENDGTTSSFNVILSVLSSRHNPDTNIDSEIIRYRMTGT